MDRTNPLNPSIGSRPLVDKKKWSGKRGSNPQPQPMHGCALPAELIPLNRTFFGPDTHQYASMWGPRPRVMKAQPLVTH